MKRLSKVHKIYTLCGFIRSVLFISYILLPTSLIYLEDNIPGNNTRNSVKQECKKDDEKCNGQTIEKKKVRKEIMDKLKQPRIMKGIGTTQKIRDLNTLEKKESVQIGLKRVQNYYFSLVNFFNTKSIADIIPKIPAYEKSIMSKISSTKSEGRKASEQNDAVAFIKFQKIKLDITRYLARTKYSIDSFWYIFKKLLLNDNTVFEILKYDNGSFCLIKDYVTSDKILELKDDINYSPLQYATKRGDSGGKCLHDYYIDNFVKAHNCKNLYSQILLKKYRKNKMCKNVAMLSLYGYCRIEDFYRQISSCLESYSMFKSSRCANFNRLLHKFSQRNNFYVMLANFILKKQVLPFYFAFKLSNKFDEDLSGQTVYLYALYKNVISVWLTLVANSGEKLSNVKKQDLQKFDVCPAKIENLLDKFLNVVITSTEDYKKTLKALNGLKENNVIIYRDYLDRSFDKFLAILTMPAKWEEHFNDIIKNNISKQNAVCLFKLIRFIIAEIYNNSKGLFEIKLQNLLYSLDPVYKIYADISSTYVEDFSLHGIFNRNDVYKQIEEFSLMDYKLGLLLLNYSMRKCIHNAINLDDFLKELNYTEDMAKSIKCFILNKGDIRKCKKTSDFSLLINLLNKSRIKNLDLSNISASVSKIASKWNNMSISDIFDKYKNCCKENCLIPGHCNNRDIKGFCKSCDETNGMALCDSIENKGIQDSIQKCCYNGLIQKVQETQDEKYDPCKLGYSVTGNMYKWEYPEFRCSIGTVEQKECYQLMVQYMGKLLPVLKYLLQNSSGKFDEGKAFCKSPKVRLDELCCNNIRVCDFCQSVDKYNFCSKSISEILIFRQLFKKKLEENTSSGFVDFLKKKIRIYSRDGFQESKKCDYLK